MEEKWLIVAAGTASLLAMSNSCHSNATKAYSRKIHEYSSIIKFCAKNDPSEPPNDGFIAPKKWRKTYDDSTTKKATKSRMCLRWQHCFQFRCTYRYIHILSISYLLLKFTSNTIQLKSTIFYQILPISLLE